MAGGWKGAGGGCVMIRVALKMLRGELAKCAMPSGGICLSTLLMVQGLAFGIGVIQFSCAAPVSIRAPIWAAMPLVSGLGDNHPLRDLAGVPSHIVRIGDDPMDQTLAGLVEAGGESKRSAHTLF